MNEIAKIENLSITRQVERELATNDAVMAKLSSTDQRIIKASKGTAICNLDQLELVRSMAQVFSAVAKDLNVKMPKQYTLTRITEVILQYHKELTMQDIKLAFELAIVGELNIDNKCYGNFNIEYVCRILNGYNERKRIAFDKAMRYAPKETNARPIAQDEIDAWKKGICEKVWKEYKDTGKLTDNAFHIMVVYERLKAKGLVNGEITEADRKRAFALYKVQVMHGLVNKYQGAFVRREGAQSKEIDYPAQQQAQRREVKEAFDKLLKK